MLTIDLDYTILPFTALGPRAIDLMQTFGMTLDTLRRRALHHRLTLTLSHGQICFLAGPSGAGKSVLLNALYERIPQDARIRVESIPLETDYALIDAIDVSLAESLPILTRAGLADIPALLQPPATLSEGQKWRYRMARAILAQKQFIFADEFCAPLDDAAAKAVAWHLRQAASRTGRTFILAGCRSDILTDLAPDILLSVTCQAVQTSYIHDFLHPRPLTPATSQSIVTPVPPGG